ncbi:MAG: putative DNA-binding domain-containing protein [Myxococcota bacterium]
MAGEGLPPDWREQLVDMIRGARPLADDWFTGGPVCTPADQIAIYVDQYRMRLYDALRLEVAGLAHLLGDGPDGEALLRRYLLARPSRSWTLNRVADGLADWLAAERDRVPDQVPAAWIEMARLDWAVQHGFEAAAGPRLEPSALVTVPHLRLQPHVHLVRCTHNVHEIRSAVLTRAEPPPLVPGDFPIVVFRRDDAMRHWCVPLGLWGILDAIGRGLSIAASLDDVFARGWVTLEQLDDSVGDWFRDLAERDLVTTR